MNVGTPIRAGNPSPDDPFAAALAAYTEARDNFTAARESLDLAQTEQAAAIAALPESKRADLAELETISERLGMNAKGEAAFTAMIAADEALAALMATPALDIRSIIQKMNAATSAPSSTSVQARAHLDALLIDARRLASGEASHAA